MREAEVFSAYETNIIFSTLETKSNQYSLSTSNTIQVDNLLNTRQYPIIKITSGSSNITGFNIDGVRLGLDVVLGNTDTLTLDFKNQEYKLNDISIIDTITFLDNERPHFKENSICTVEIEYVSAVDVEITYEDYEQITEPKFIQDFRISYDKTYLEDNKFKSSKKKRLVLDSENYNVTISNFSYDWILGNAIEEDKTFRIDYTEDHSNGDKLFNKSIVGIKFNTYERYFRDSTGILIDTLTGEGINIY